MPQIVPIIATPQQAYDYLNISAADAGANLLNGTTTRAAFILRLLQITATQIVQWCNYDYTIGQAQFVNLNGNNQYFWQFEFPIATIAVASVWNPLYPTAAPINDAANLAILVPDTTIIYRTDGGIFQRQLYYSFQFTQGVGNLYNGWPLSCLQVQLEMVATIYRESNNADNVMGPNNVNSYLLGTKSIEAYLSTHKEFGTGNENNPYPLITRWKDAIRGARVLAI